jgi:hypothetical protein
MRDSTGLSGVHHKECCGHIDAGELEDTNMNKSYPKECCVRTDPCESAEFGWRKTRGTGPRKPDTEFIVGLSRMD